MKVMRISKWMVFFFNLVFFGIVFFSPKTTYGAYQAELSTGNSLSNIDLINYLQKMNQAIQDNQNSINRTENEINLVNSNLGKLQQEIFILDDKLKKRDKLLKDRAKSYQESGGNLSYLDVLLGAANLGDFIERAGTVAKIVQADQDLFLQQKAEKEQYESKRQILESKLSKLNRLKTEYEEMQTQSLEQKQQYEMLKKQTEAQNQNQLMVSTSPVSSFPSGSDQVQGLAAKILNFSQKYIGHSAYVFGGGRTAYDIQNGRFDCSGFVHWVFSQVGINVGTSTDSIKNSGVQVPANNMQPGDLVFFNTYKQDGHVGVYIGNGQFIGSQSSTGVAIADMTSGYWKAKFNGRVIRL